MNKPVIGLVGGIGSGKSLVAKLLAEHGGRIVSGDDAGHEALRQPDIRQKVVDRFGRGILDESGEIVRRKLAVIVFAQEQARKDLETLVFPWIEKELEKQIERARAEPDVRFVIVDAAVMLEAGWAWVCDRLIFVDAPREIRMRRLQERGWSVDQTEAREKAQWSLVQKRHQATAIIDNSGDRAETARQVEALVQKWKL
ncbi:MAG TPA: dephospho-CoA kinase [Gemmataceae bacterium]|jgi:dephospho-CoA kinase|nr:dephospho-CoA kinase [Gemmataceae bacterium]